MHVVFSRGKLRFFVSVFSLKAAVLIRKTKGRNALDDDDDDDGRFETMRSISIRCRELYI